jgi:predicted GNAT superfamily acetyltransferase
VSSPTGTVDPGVADRARRTAAEAAARAGVRIGLVEDAAGTSEVSRFLAELWNSTEAMPAEVLRGIWHAGGSALAAYAGDRLVGAAVAVFEPPATRAVYSLVAGAATSDRGIGFALKQAQRAWALERGATVMTWTFDPLIGRNARFNLVKLGARAVGYVIDFYGPMDDVFNAGDESDRLTVRWDLVTAEPGGAEPGGAGPAGTRSEGPGSEGAGSDGRESAAQTRVAPDGGPLEARAGALRWCRVPRDVVALRSADPVAALAWRRAVRGVLTDAFAAGYLGTSMSRDGWYRLEQP